MTSPPGRRGTPGTVSAAGCSPNQATLDLLGEVHHVMGDLAAATGCSRSATTDRAREAHAAFRVHYGSIEALVNAIPARAPIDAFPPAVRDRLRAIQAEAREHDVHREPRVKTRFTPSPVFQTPQTKLAGGACLILALAVLAGPWIYGVGKLLGIL